MPEIHGSSMDAIQWRRWNGDMGVRRVSPQHWDWVGLGTAPIPEGKVRTFLFHVGAGLCMGYPLIDIVAFAFRGRNHFNHNWRAARRAEFLQSGYLEEEIR